MSRKVPLVLALAALGFAGSAFAQPAGAPAGPDRAQAASPTFSSYDADRDQRITREEASTNPALIAQFPKLDRNRDNALDTAEFARFEAQMHREPDVDPQPADEPIALPRTSTPPPSR